MLILTVIVKIIVLWTLLNMLFKTIFGAAWGIFGMYKRREPVTLKTAVFVIAMSFAVNAVLPILQNVATLVAIYRNLKNKLAAWSFKRQYPNVQRGDFSALANGAL